MSKHDILVRGCSQCNHSITLFKLKTASGSWVVKSVCDNKCMGRFIKRSEIENWEDLPEYIPKIVDHRQCCVCGADGAEVHHWAPFHIFGDEADKWPVALLCVKCHLRWHKLVTPEMSSRRGAHL